MNKLFALSITFFAGLLFLIGVFIIKKIKNNLYDNNSQKMGFFQLYGDFTVFF